jgi:RNA 3'-terminal phosphate cyclase (ATP)
LKKEKKTNLIDGSAKSGSGTILRYSLVLSCLLKENLHIYNIRSQRKKPGLMAQHLRTVEACIELTKGRAEGLYKHSLEIVFYPGPKIRDGQFYWDIGTAGSTTLMAQCLLPLGFFVQNPSTYTIVGGLFQDYAPNPFHMKYVLMEIIKKMSLSSDLSLVRPGYVPSGKGEIKVKIDPLISSMKALSLPEQGRVTHIKGIAFSSHLKDQKVSERMAQACRDELKKKMEIEPDIEIIYDKTSPQKGAALFIYALTDTGCIIGADMSGAVGRRSEKIGKQTAGRLLDDIESGATVDRFTADQLILYAALAQGKSTYIVPQITDHIDSNIWLVQNILGAHVRLEGKRLTIKGIGMTSH